MVIISLSWVLFALKGHMSLTVMKSVLVWVWSYRQIYAWYKLTHQSFWHDSVAWIFKVYICVCFWTFIFLVQLELIFRLVICFIFYCIDYSQELFLLTSKCKLQNFCTVNDLRGDDDYEWNIVSVDISIFWWHEGQWYTIIIYLYKKFQLLYLNIPYWYQHVHIYFLVFINPFEPHARLVKGSWPCMYWTVVFWISNLWSRKFHEKKIPTWKDLSFCKLLPFIYRIASWFSEILKLEFQKRTMNISIKVTVMHGHSRYKVAKLTYQTCTV